MPKKPETQEVPQETNETNSDSQETKTVEVKKDALDQLIQSHKDQQQTIDNLTKQIEESNKTIDMLVKTADKRALSRYQSQQGGEINRTCKVSMIAGKVIVAWRMVIDEVGKDMAGVWRENQIVEITTEDGEKAQMRYMDFVKVQKEDVEIAGKSEQDGKLTYKLRWPSNSPRAGQEFDLDPVFIN